MTLHDAAMSRFGQWWRRNVRAGHAFAEISWLHRGEPLQMWRRETRSNWFWGLVVPVLALVPAWWTYGLSLLLLLGYPVLFYRIYRGRRRPLTPNPSPREGEGLGVRGGRGEDSRTARAYAFFCVLGKFPQVQGQLRYHRHRL